MTYPSIHPSSPDQRWVFSFVLQEENEIPASVFVKDPPPFPRDDILEECEVADKGERSQDSRLQTIELSSDEDVGLEAEEEEEEVWPHEMENMERSTAEKLKRSSLKKEREEALKQQAGSQSDRLTGFLSAGGQLEESFFPPEHREENDQDWNKNSFSWTTRKDQAEDVQLEGFTPNIKHQEGTTQILSLHQSDLDDQFRAFPGSFISRNVFACSKRKFCLSLAA